MGTNPSSHLQQSEKSIKVPMGNNRSLIIITRKYMHAETPRLADKTIVFSEHEVFKVVVMVTR